MLPVRGDAYLQFYTKVPPVLPRFLNCSRCFASISEAFLTTSVDARNDRPLAGLSEATSAATFAFFGVPLISDLRPLGRLSARSWRLLVSLFLTPAGVKGPRDFGGVGELVLLLLRRLTGGVGFCSSCSSSCPSSSSVDDDILVRAARSNFKGSNHFMPRADVLSY